jgi:acetylornithine deacetylase
MRTLDYLSHLVAFDTRNPPGGDGELISYLRAELMRDGMQKPDRIEHVVVESGRHSYLAAVWGVPNRMINIHCDTVPANDGWSASPFELRLIDDRAYGLGTADTKGNIAAVLSLLNTQRPQNALVLFSGDEENAGSCCVRAFLQSELAHGIKNAIVCEPTDLRIGTSHRGYVKFRVAAEGPGGHSSRVDEMVNPMMTVCRAATLLDDLAHQYHDDGNAPFFGLCLNVGVVTGGLAANVVPSRATLECSLRPPPGFDVRTFFERFEHELSVLKLSARLIQSFEGPALKTPQPEAFTPYFTGLAGEMTALDFWTETALFVHHGINSVVFGPGSVRQAHAPDEYVEIADLKQAGEVYQRFLCGE